MRIWFPQSLFVSTPGGWVILQVAVKEWAVPCCVSSRCQLLGGQRGHHGRLARKIPEYIQGETEQRRAVTLCYSCHRHVQVSLGCTVDWAVICCDSSYPKQTLKTVYALYIHSHLYFQVCNVLLDFGSAPLMALLIKRSKPELYQVTCHSYTEVER